MLGLPAWLLAAMWALHLICLMDRRRRQGIETSAQPQPPMETMAWSASWPACKAHAYRCAAGPEVRLWAVPSKVQQLRVAHAAATAALEFFASWTGVEQPLSKVSCAWMRCEFNLALPAPHLLHCLCCLLR